MNYNAFNPSEALTAFVKCYLTLEAAEESKLVKQRILPDGCMEMIFHYAEPYKQYNESGDFIIQPKCFVFGQITTPLEIEPTGSTGIFSVRFYPDAFTPFAKMPAHLMNNRAVPLGELFGNEGIDLEAGNICRQDRAEDKNNRNFSVKYTQYRAVC